MTCGTLNGDTDIRQTRERSVTMKKKEFIQKYNYCGEAFVRREELNTFKNLGVKKDA